MLVGRLGVSFGFAVPLSAKKDNILLSFDFVMTKAEEESERGGRGRWARLRRRRLAVGIRRMEERGKGENKAPPLCCLILLVRRSGWLIAQFLILVVGAVGGRARVLH